MKKIQFNIEQYPPSGEELEACRARYEKRVQWKTYIKRISATSIMLLTIIFLQGHVKEDVSIVGVLSFLLLSLIFIFFLAKVVIDELLPCSFFENAESSLLELEPISFECDSGKFLKVAGFYERYPLVKRYFEAVAEQHRLPVKGEYYALNEYVEEQKNRLDKEQAYQKGLKAWEKVRQG